MSAFSYSMKPLPKSYDHKTSEKKWQDHWFSNDTYAWRNDAPREQTYVIDTPPPTVSGLLHMGHVFSYTQCDFVARYQRMKGMDVFYPMGFDDNGLPTERLVEKVKKIRAVDMSREDFIAQCQSVSEEARAEFRALFQSIALSVDWHQEYHTISDEARKISQLSFLDLHNKQQTYRKDQPFFWDPVDQTAIAQAEIEDKEMDSSWNDIWFGIEGSDEKILIGTTRPELIPACVAIFYHPEDARYKHLAGKQAVTPLFGVKVPVLTDEAVEPEKGTGIMMCCTFGDEADIEKWKKHTLPMRVVLNKFGKLDFTNAEWLNANAATEAVQNKKVSNRDPKHLGARETIIALLGESGDLKESKPIRHSVKCAERSGAPLEILPTPQWFVKVTDKKDPLKSRAKECTWYPDWMRLRMEQWIDGLNSDWCISRQRYFGVPFPVWYSTRAGEEGKILIASPDQLPVNPLTDVPAGYSRDEVTPDMDVMDTWATSSISPQISSKGIGSDFILDAQRHAKLYPADLRPQAHEIIRTWAFYTVVKSHLHGDCIPWKNLMISGWCLAEDKTKMSKSKGNVVTPVELIEEQGTDAVRYWAATSRLGADTAFSKDLLKIGKKLVTKLWNATQFAAIHLEKLNDQPSTARGDVERGVITESLDLWILTRLHRAADKATQSFEAYEYADALRATEDFFWNDFCDNYLELVKKRIYDEAGESASAQRSAVYTMYHCLQGILRLFAPIVPHITEELFAHLFPADYETAGSLHARGQWPNAADYPLNAQAEASGIAALSVLNAVRKAKSDRGVSIKYPITHLQLGNNDAEVEGWALLEPVIEDVKGAGNVGHVEWTSGATLHQVSEDERFRFDIVFADAADVA